MSRPFHPMLRIGLLAALTLSCAACVGQQMAPAPEKTLEAVWQQPDRLPKNTQKPGYAIPHGVDSTQITPEN